jgi:hypothetical protein
MGTFAFLENSTFEWQMSFAGSKLFSRLEFEGRHEGEVAIGVFVIVCDSATQGRFILCLLGSFSCISNEIRIVLVFLYTYSCLSLFYRLACSAASASLTMSS